MVGETKIHPLTGKRKVREPVEAGRNVLINGIEPQPSCQPLPIEAPDDAEGGVTDVIQEGDLLVVSETGWRWTRVEVGAIALLKRPVWGTAVCSPQTDHLTGAPG